MTYRARLRDNTTRAASVCFCRISLALALTFLALSVRAENHSPSIITNLAAVRTMPLAASLDHPPFKLRAVVTYCDPDWRVLFVQDGAFTAFVDDKSSLDDQNFKLIQGQVVDFDGTVSAGPVHCNISDRHARIVGESPMPAALELVD